MKYYFFNNMQLPLLEKVYQPREDSYLLAKHVKLEKPGKALDMGCGSGIQTVNLLMQGAKVTAVDVDELALKNAEMCAQAIAKHSHLDILKSNLFEGVPEDASFDYIVFNPPYVESHSLAYAAVDGGKKGRQVLDAFLEKIHSYLSKTGVCYFLQSSLNGLKETEAKLKEKGLKGKIVGREKIWFEELLVYQISKE